MKKQGHSIKGFTLIELLVVISIIGLLSSIVLASVMRTRERAYYARALQEFHSIETAVELYRQDHADQFPDDVQRDTLPPDLDKYISPSATPWPKAPWPGSVYDWDNWTTTFPNDPGVQISIRFCPYLAPDTSECHFPKEAWASNFDQNSALYYCLDGHCRAHGTFTDSAGYCVNCNQP